MEKKWEYNETVQKLFMDFKKAYGSFWVEVLYNILIEFRVPMKLVRLIMCLNETYSETSVKIFLSKMSKARRCLMATGFQEHQAG
jgi:hypothetical protein